MKYTTILADPPWKFGNQNTGGSMKSGASNKYPTMSLNEICNLSVTLDKISYKITDIIDKNAMLFLWVPTALKPYAFEVMKSWGFNYKTTIYWEKTGKLGMGFYLRNQIEECLVGTRGKTTPFRSSSKNIIHAKPRKHSQKPEEFFQLIEPEIEKYNLNPKIELFAREKRDGWEGWGLEYPI